MHRLPQSLQQVKVGDKVLLNDPYSEPSLVPVVKCSEGGITIQSPGAAPSAFDVFLRRNGKSVVAPSTTISVASAEDIAAWQQEQDRITAHRAVETTLHRGWRAFTQDQLQRAQAILEENVPQSVSARGTTP